MAVSKKPTDCYIAAFLNPCMDPYFESNGFCRGLILFAIPSHGVLFRCRAYGDCIDLVFGAFFSLLRFIRTRLKEEKISDLVVHSSNPEFVFSFAGYGRYVTEGSARDRLIREYGQKMKIAVCHVDAHKNRALISAADFPSIPRDRKSSLQPDPGDHKKFEFKPIQKGIHI